MLIEISTEKEDNMKRYTFIADYEYGNSISVLQLKSESEKQALFSWIDHISFPFIKEKGKNKMREEVNSGITNPCHLQRMKNISYMFQMINGKRIDVHIIEHFDVQQISNLSIFVVVVFFKGGTYVKQLKAINQLDALKEWANHLSSRYSKRNEMIVIKNYICETKTILSVGLSIWKHSFKLSENDMSIYVVQQ